MAKPLVKTLMHEVAALADKKGRQEIMHKGSFYDRKLIPGYTEEVRVVPLGFSC